MTHEPVDTTREHKQAVVLIHGIGEPRPMQTLREFVETVWARDPGLTVSAKKRPEWPAPDPDAEPNTNPFWIVPDKRAGSSELRRITTPANDSKLRTDFYELYWADVMAGNRLKVLTTWLWRIAYRSPNDVPKEATSLWIALWVVIAFLATSLMAFGASFFGALSAVYQRLIWLTSSFFIGLLALAAVFKLYPIFKDMPNWTFNRIGALTAMVLVLLAAALIWQFPLCQLRYVVELLTPQIWFALGWALLIWFIYSAALPYIGDAAQYTFATPETVEKREAVRSRGLALLRDLHKGDRYERVILVGHSLGSIIAYDLIQLFWAEQGPSPANPPSATVIQTFHDVDHTITPSVAAATLRPLQRACSRSLARKRNTPWLISDLVTLGSPLTHAEFLVGDTSADFQRLCRERVLAQCPPAQDPGPIDERTHKATPTIFYNDGGKEYPNHASTFAAVRWTNIYDKRRFIVFGDFIGGSVKLFGSGIDNHDVRIGGKWGFFTHTKYWTADGGSKNTPHHIRVLRDAMDLLDRA